MATGHVHEEQLLFWGYAAKPNFYQLLRLIQIWYTRLGSLLKWQIKLKHNQRTFFLLLFECDKQVFKKKKRKINKNQVLWNDKNIDKTGIVNSYELKLSGLI